MSHRPATRLTNDAWAVIGTSLRLSGRELQIVRCLIESSLDTDDEIAGMLGMSPHTVHTHLERMYRKIGVASRSHLILQVFAEYVRYASLSHDQS